MSVNEIAFQIILTFSLNYEKIPVLLPLLSEPKIEEGFLIHNDQILIFHHLKNNISFPLSKVFKDYLKKKNLILEKSLYEELQKQNKLDLLNEEIKEKNDG